MNLKTDIKTIQNQKRGKGGNSKKRASKGWGSLQHYIHATATPKLEKSAQKYWGNNDEKL